MSKGQAIGKCNVPSKRPPHRPCKHQAGYDTGHLGRGPCKLHGGSLPNVEKKYAREQAHEFVVGQLGYEVDDIDPIDGALLAVRMAAGARTYWLNELGKAYEAGESPSLTMVEGYRMAMQDLGRMSDVASKAGVAERLIAITERMAEQITLAFEDALIDEKIGAKIRARLVTRFAAGLAKIEEDSPLALAPPTD